MRNYKTIFIVLALCSFYSITAYADRLDEIIEEQKKLNREQGKIAEKLDKFLETKGLENAADEKSSDKFFAYRIAASCFFSLIGFCFLVYGKKAGASTPIVIGLILMIYPYFVTNLLLQCSIGAALLIALFFARRRQIGF